MSRTVSMLQRLSIKNYAIIDELDLNLSGKLSIITGETGAGKSILLGALGLILGQRADTGVLYEEDKKCIVEGQFDITNYKLKDFFVEHELDYEDQTYIRREINPAGKSRAFINDTPVNLQTLRTLSDQLVDLHSQHETLDLNTAQFQITVIDAMAQHGALKEKYQKAFRAYKITLSKLEALLEEHQQLKADMDYYQFQLNELHEVDLKAGEQAAIEQELNTLNNAEDIKRTLLATVNAMTEDEMALINQLQDITNQISGIKKYHPNLESLGERLQSTLIDIEDIAKELEHIEQNTQYDAERIAEIQDRLDQLYRLESKHQVQSDEDLLQIQSLLEKKLEKVDSSTHEIDQLQKEVQTALKELQAMAGQLSAQRQKVIPGFEKKVNERLAKVGMPHAQLTVKLEQLPPDQLHFNGQDTIQFLFTANKGSTPQDLKKIASGGELSRLMLCIKSLVAGSTALPTLIFDEIDTGVSGETAAKVGQIMEQLSDNHQVIAITHLPQIASRGDFHFKVYKESDKNTTHTRVKQLDEAERILEIAKMLSGEQPTEAAMANAKELLHA